MVRKIYKAKKEMEKEIGRTPSVPELAHYLETSVEKLRLYTDSSRTVLSLELPVNMGDYKGDDKRTLGDRIASDSPTPEEDAEVESLRRDIHDVVNELPARERDVLVARFGLDDGTPKSVEETSKRLGITRDRVRLVEARALNKLRHPQLNYKLKDYVGGADTEEEHAEELSMSPERIWSF
jgi:RNA polymerase primary sigma factor